MARRNRPDNNISDMSQLQGINNPTVGAEQTAVDNMMSAEINASNQAVENAAPKHRIGREEIIKANQILMKYKAGKAKLEQKIIRNEEFWKLRQWEYVDNDKDSFQPATSWLWSCIQSRYSDVMDSYPTCNFMPRQQDDKAEAIKLSSIVPVILEQNRYEDTYSDLAWYLLKNGGCVQGIFWDATKHNGLGDIAIRKMDILNMFWEPGITDIQESANVFSTELVDNEELISQYPELEGHLGGEKVSLSKYRFDDHIDTSNKSLVVDWYYHRYVGGKKTLQYVKYVNDVVLYATENETQRPMQIVEGIMGAMPVETGQPSIAERGLYDHAMYPFVFTSLYPVEYTLCGYGITDIGKDTQLIIDKLNKAIAMNAISGAVPRYMVRMDSGINETEYCDLNKRIVHSEGSVNDDNVRVIQHAGLDGIYVSFLEQKINELKYVTSNQDVNNGATSSGVTSASGIAALQEAGGKNARSTNKTIYRSYRDVIYQVVELVRQFYDAPRMFRINPDGMQEAYIPYDNSGLQPQPQMVGGMDMGLRKPEFDIEVTAEKQNPYKKMENNDLALQFYNLGFFNPQLTTQALACLDMMDFQQRDDVRRTISKNGTLQEMLVMYQQMALQLAQQIDPALAEQIGQQILEQSGQVMKPEAIDGDLSVPGDKTEHPFVERARENARSSTEAND